MQGHQAVVWVSFAMKLTVPGPSSFRCSYATDSHLLYVILGITPVHANG